MAASILYSAAQVIRGFQGLTHVLRSSDTNSKIDPELLQDEFGRFRVWSGNLGALQKGHSSLDYRLRDSPLLSSNVLKLLSELDENLIEAQAVVSGARLPYEQQSLSGLKDDDTDDDFFSEDDDDDESDNQPTPPKTELEQRYLDLVDIIDNLYKLSVRIRQPTLRNRSLKAASYRPKDPETGVDLIEQYAIYDLCHTRELIASLRADRVAAVKLEEDPLVERLSSAITLRRRQFKYWKRHRDKLAVSTILDERPKHPVPVNEESEIRISRDTDQLQPENRVVTTLKATPSEKTGRTLLSGTEATHHHQTLDDIVDSKSVTSYATTVRDVTGRGIDLPPPPKGADGEKDFECPYCFIICPARYGKGRSWRSHLLQDIQPYLCTYVGCENPVQLFRSRREWVEHEASHRKAWRCPEHPNAVFGTSAGLENHLRKEHASSIPEPQIDSIVKVGETSTVDMREACPICLIHTQTDDLKDNLQNHIANHLERIATFALPSSNSLDDGSDGGGSSVASRGRTHTTASSQDIDTISEDGSIIRRDDKADETNEEATHEQPEELQVPSGDLLSAETLDNLPDATQQRLDLLLTHEADHHADADEIDIGDEVSPDDYQAALQVFRKHVLSFRGSQFNGMRLKRQAGWYQGFANFSNTACSRHAMQLFDRTLFKELTIEEAGGGKAALHFTFKALNDSPAGPSHQPEDTEQKSKEDPELEASGDEDQELEELDELKEENLHWPAESLASGVSGDSSFAVNIDGELPILTHQEVPTLRTLYTTGRLAEREFSHASDVAYNQLVCLCFHDITRLRVDAIVNSANRGNTAGQGRDSLNGYIHRIAGPGLSRECKEIGPMNEGEARLTAGYNLPSSHVIHTAAPNYGTHNGSQRYKVLAECYRSSLKLAMESALKTVAFPSLAAAGRGYPPRLAAQIAVQTLREFLDANKEHGFEKIIFCVFNGIDEKAYRDLMPIYFPPTHGDREHAQAIKQTNRDHFALGTQLRDIHSQVRQMSEELQVFSENIPTLGGLGEDMRTLLVSLAALGDLFLTRTGPVSSHTASHVNDIDLICSVLQVACLGMAELVEQARHVNHLGKSTHRTVWEDYNYYMRVNHGLDMTNLMTICRDFAQWLNEAISGNRPEYLEVPNMRARLETYRLKQTGKDEEDARDKFEEVMYFRQFHRDPIPHTRTDVIKLHQIPTIARLYQVGELEAKETSSIPDNGLNHAICFLRGDITRIECDAICNSTDKGFTGSGQLDRTIFKKAGLEMAAACAEFGSLQEGDVRVTPGFALPARNVIHTIPPIIYHQSSKETLRQLYQELLWTAVSLKAKSLAIPTIGTGVLDFPARDCAALAMREVKRFLETVDADNRIEIIIFVVYGANDESIYKSLLPWYFPPVDGPPNKAITPKVGSARPVDHTSRPPSFGAGESSKPKRTLFGSIGEAFKSVRFSSKSSLSPSRSVKLSRSEETSFDAFEGHVPICPTCNNLEDFKETKQSLCDLGHSAAQRILRDFYMKEDQTVHTTNLKSGGPSVKVEIPQRYAKCLELLSTMEKASRNRGERGQSHSPSHEHLESTPPPGVTIDNAEITIPGKEVMKTEPAVSSASIFAYTNDRTRMEAIYPYECQLFIWPGRVDIVAPKSQTTESASPLMALELTPTSGIGRLSNTEVTIRDHVGERNIVFQTRSGAGCNELIQLLKIARRPDALREGSQRTVQERIPAHRDISWSEIKAFLTKQWPGVADFKERRVDKEWVFEVPENLTGEQRRILTQLTRLQGTSSLRRQLSKSASTEPQDEETGVDNSDQRSIHSHDSKSAELGSASLLTQQLRPQDDRAQPRRIPTPEPTTAEDLAPLTKIDLPDSS